MITRYGKPVVLAEVGVPWDHPQAQAQAIIADLLARARAVKGGQGRGIFYWEPEAYSWKDYPMGAFDRTGKPGPAMDGFKEH